MIRSSAHSLKFANRGKRYGVMVLLGEYRRLLQEIIDDAWYSGIPGYDFNISENKLRAPSYLPNDYLKTFDSWFTASPATTYGINRHLFGGEPGT